MASMPAAIRASRVCAIFSARLRGVRLVLGFTLLTYDAVCEISNSHTEPYGKYFYYGGRPMDVQTEARKGTTRVTPPFSGTLDDLLQLDAAALERLYAEARVPKLEDLAGDLRGRMLAIPNLPPPLAGAGRALAPPARFPWRGKSFPSQGQRGEGSNRAFTPGNRAY